MAVIPPEYRARLIETIDGDYYCVAFRHKRSATSGNYEYRALVFQGPKSTQVVVAHFSVPARAAPLTACPSERWRLIYEVPPVLG